MTFNKLFAPLVVGLLVFSGCKTTDRIITVGFDGEERTLDTISVTASRKNFVAPTYNGAETRTHDLIHTKLDVRFDWQKQYLYGKAVLDLQPIFYASDLLRLDAKGFDIEKVALVTTTGQIPLQYRYDNNKDLYITLDKKYARNEKYKIYISYTAKPNELPLGGSDAITSDKGLYFINPLGKEAGKPQQIWTQGETESSSCWFPTIDQPNERCTQEIFMTVQDKFKTLSNGNLQSSFKNSNGTRTDYWVMDLPHAPYLFMMAVGEFSVTIDEWNGKLVEYYVEPKFKADAKNIYPNTKEMLTFFSERLGVPYPWSKYSQIVVRDYVSGAMENTTAVIFGEFMQMSSRALIDHKDLNESIVAHEMMHHWFGDLVTCESWANLALNESFANYSEYLWFEHKYGRDAGDYIRKNQIAGYMNQAVANGDTHPLIHYGYKDKEDMFDAHSYNKGGTILHMLRYYLGDDAFFAGLQKYLQDNKYQAAEVHDLRIAFEAVTGQDLNWFFNQWFFTAGHPNLKITKVYDAATSTLKVTVEQTQSIKNSTVFRLPFRIDVYGGNKTEQHEVMMTEQKQTFAFYTPIAPTWVAVDAERVILGKREYTQTKEELINQFRLSPRFQNRFEALKELRYSQKGNPAVIKLFEDAMKDPFWAIREMAIDAVMMEKGDDILISKMLTIAKNDPRPQVRRAAMERIGGLEDKKYLDVCKNAISTEQSYMVIAAALYAINRTDAKEGIEYAELLKNTDNVSILLAVGGIFEKTTDRKYLSFYKQNWDKTDNYARFSFLGSYANLLQNINDEALIKTETVTLKNMAMNNDVSQWGRYASSSAIKKLRDGYYSNSEAQFNNIVTKIGELNDDNKKKGAALQALEEMKNEKTNANYQKAVAAIKLLKGNSVESILNMVDDFNKPMLYDALNTALSEIKKWEKDETLAKLYKSW